VVTTLDVARDPSEAGFVKSSLDRVSDHLGRYVESGRLSGYLVTVARDGQLVWTGRGGYQDKEAGQRVRDDTIWRIYSMTKPLTCLLAMMLYEEARFDLHDEIRKWIPAFAEPRVYVGGTASDPQTVPAEQPVRVGQLLSHTSGLTYGFNHLHVVDEMYRDAGYDFGFAKGADLERAVNDWAGLPLLFEPGSAWNYSVSVDVLGRLIEIWTGQTLDVVLR